MALLNSEAYGDLAKVSATAPKRSPGKFYKVWIAAKKRAGQQVGTMQAMYGFQEDKPSVDEDYMVHNAETVYFIPYFSKRFWEKNVTVKIQGEDRQQLVAFSWDDIVPKIDDQCKFIYVFGCLLLNTETKKAVVHQRDVPDAGIKKGDPVLVYFRCDGTKFNGAMKLIGDLAEKTKTLPPLSNSPEFEKNVVTPRRFICIAKVGSVSTDKYGDKDVFEFHPEIQLPDKAVEQVMNSAMSLQSEFEKQFDRTAQAKTGVKAGPSADSDSSLPFNKPAEGGSSTVTPPADVPASKPGENFDLGI